MAKKDFYQPTDDELLAKWEREEQEKAESKRLKEIADQKFLDERQAELKRKEELAKAAEERGKEQAQKMREFEQSEQERKRLEGEGRARQKAESDAAAKVVAAEDYAKFRKELTKRVVKQKVLMLVAGLIIVVGISGIRNVRINQANRPRVLKEPLNVSVNDGEAWVDGWHADGSPMIRLGSVGADGTILIVLPGSNEVITMAAPSIADMSGLESLGAPIANIPANSVRNIDGGPTSSPANGMDFQRPTFLENLRVFLGGGSR